MFLTPSSMVPPILLLSSSLCSQPAASSSTIAWIRSRLLLLLLADRRGDSGWMIWMTPGANRTTTRERGSGIVEQRTGDRDECCRLPSSVRLVLPIMLAAAVGFGGWSARPMFLLRPAALAGVSKAVCRGSSSSLRASPARSAGWREGRTVDARDIIRCRALGRFLLPR